MSACDILVIANLNMDLILEQKNSQQTSRKRYADSFTLSPGGNGYNEAVAAARMGATVALAGMIGSDSFGAQLKASLNEEITDSQLVRVVPGSSGLSLDPVLCRTGEYLLGHRGRQCLSGRGIYPRIGIPYRQGQAAGGGLRRTVCIHGACHPFGAEARHRRNAGGLSVPAPQ